MLNQYPKSTQNQTFCRFKTRLSDIFTETIIRIGCLVGNFYIWGMMVNLVKINICLSLTLVIGIILTQIVITKFSFDMGGMAPFLAFLSAIIFLPFTITAFMGVLNREQHLNKIKIGINIGIFFQVILLVILPLFFDKEFIYLSFVGVILGFVMFKLRKNIEIQLLILNIIGALVWISISLLGLLSN